MKHLLHLSIIVCAFIVLSCESTNPTAVPVKPYAPPEYYHAFCYDYGGPPALSDSTPDVWNDSWYPDRSYVELGDVNLGYCFLYFNGKITDLHIGTNTVTDGNIYGPRGFLQTPRGVGQTIELTEVNSAYIKGQFGELIFEKAGKTVRLHLGEFLIHMP